jgi:RNA polymerase sigma-70 factor (ECF subfamily)
MDNNFGKGFAHLLTAALAGSIEARGQLFESYGEALRCYARHRLSSRLLQKCGSSDLVQDTFIKAHQHFADFRGSSPEQFWAWLVSILTHNLADLRRHYASASRRVAREMSPGDDGLPPPDLADRAATPFEDVLRKELRVDYARTLAKLPDVTRQVVLLHVRDGLQYGDVARRLGLSSADAARKCCERAVAHVHEKVRDSLEGSAAMPPRSGSSEGAAPAAS